MMRFIGDIQCTDENQDLSVRVGLSKTDRCFIVQGHDWVMLPKGRLPELVKILNDAAQTPPQESE